MKGVASMAEVGMRAVEEVHLVAAASAVERVAEVAAVETAGRAAVQKAVGAEGEEATVAGSARSKNRRPSSPGNRSSTRVATCSQARCICTYHRLRPRLQHS